MIREALSIYIPTAAIGVLSMVGLAGTAAPESVAESVRVVQPVAIPAAQIGNVTQSVTVGAAQSGTPPHSAARLRGGYTTGEYAELCGLSVREIQERCRLGEIDCVRSENGHYLIPIAPGG